MMKSARAPTLTPRPMRSRVARFGSGVTACYGPRVRARLERLLDRLINETQGQPALRSAALARGFELGGVPRPGAEALPSAFGRYIELVARHAWKITDADVDELRRANIDEDAIYEATVAAAT